MAATNVITFPAAPASTPKAPRDSADFSDVCTMLLLLGWLAMFAAVLTASF